MKKSKDSKGKKAKVASGLTGPGLLQSQELDDASGGRAMTLGTSITCIPPPPTSIIKG